jgi:hypothetical protein
MPGTNSLESLNYQLRKVTKNRGHFPNDEAVVKLLMAGDLQHRGQESTRTTQGTPHPSPALPMRLRLRHTVDRSRPITAPICASLKPAACIRPMVSHSSALTRW